MNDPIFVGLEASLIEDLEFKDDPKLECLRNDPLGLIVGELIGQGTYANTFEACVKDGACDYVAKVVQIKDKAQEQDFRLECMISAHASKVGYGPKVHRTIVCEGYPTNRGIIIMERLESALIEHITSLTIQEFDQILECITLMHDAGVWHNDTHPYNIMRRKDGRYVLIDFGLSWPLCAPVPPLLRIADHLQWIKPDIVYDLDESELKQYRDGITPELTQHYTKTIGPKMFGNSFGRLYNQGMKCRVFDMAQIELVEIFEIQPKWGPFAIMDLYMAAIAALNPKALQLVGMETYTKRAPGVVCDYRQSEQKNRDQLAKALKERYEVGLLNQTV